MNNSLSDSLIRQLHSKQVLTEIKLHLLVTIYYLIDDDMYTKQHAADSLLDVLSLLEMEESSLKYQRLQKELKKPKQRNN